MKKLLHFLLLFFVVGISNAQTPIYKFDFDGNTNNSGSASVTTAFNTFATLNYVPNRDGIANKALNMQSTQFSAAVCPSLPVGNSPRTLNVWAKFNATVTTHYIMGWGSNNNNNAFGVNQIGTNAQFYNWGTANDVNVVNNHNTTSWYMYTFVYDGTAAKHYINGVLMSSVVKNINTIAPIQGNRLSIGRLSNDSSIVEGNYYIDDASIFNVALTDAQITSLYTNNSISPSVTLPVISNVSSSLIHEGANISYTVNAGGASADTFVLYGKTSTASELVAIGTVATGTTNTACTAITQYNSTPGAAPAGTTMYYRVQASNSVGTVYSPIYQYTQVTRPTYEVNAPTNITTSASQINYVLKPNGGNSTSVVKYGLSASSLNNTATGFSALGFTDNFSNVQLTGLTPNTLYYYVVEGTNAYGVSQSAVATFTTQGNAPTFGYIGAGATSDAANIVFDINTGGATTTTTVNYGTSSSNLNLSVAGPTVNTTVNTSQTVNLTGLQPSTTYYFNIVAVGNGSTTSNTFSFTTSAAVSFPTPIYNFEFNNNLQSQDGSVVLGPFVGGSTSYVSNGTVANGALQVNEARCQNSLPNLPLGASSRSVHVRLRFASGTLSQDNFVFNWGTGATGQAFAYHQSASSTKLLGWGGSGYDYILAGGVSFGQWYEYVFTYNGTSLSIYRDGNLLGSTPATLNTTGDIFRIGVSNSGIQKLQADIDYIRIFNQALTTSQVSSLYANPALSNSVAEINNFKFNLYPNPASDILNIEFNEAIKSVEIYSLQGQKVLETNQTEINISNLASGMYIVKVQDLSGSFATKKLIIE